jgi:hypothetical protein
MAARPLKVLGLIVLVLSATGAVAAAQNFNGASPLTLPQQGETAISPALPGTGPGTLTNETTGTNPLTGLPCSGLGSLAVSGAGGLPDSATAPPGSDATTDAPEDELPAITSVFGSTTTLGAC